MKSDPALAEAKLAVLDALEASYGSRIGDVRGCDVDVLDPFQENPVIELM